MGNLAQLVRAEIGLLIIRWRESINIFHPDGFESIFRQFTMVQNGIDQAGRMGAQIFVAEQQTGFAHFRKFFQLAKNMLISFCPVARPSLYLTPLLPSVDDSLRGLWFTKINRNTSRTKFKMPGHGHLQWNSGVLTAGPGE